VNNTVLQVCKLTRARNNTTTVQGDTRPTTTRRKDIEFLHGKQLHGPTHGSCEQSCLSSDDSVGPTLAYVHDVAEMRLDVLVSGLCHAMGIESGSSHLTHSPLAHFVSGHLHA
jgi:hypothetical protein